MTEPSLYSQGFKDGYGQALEDFGKALKFSRRGRRLIYFWEIQKDYQERLRFLENGAPEPLDVTEAMRLAATTTKQKQRYKGRVRQKDQDAPPDVGESFLGGFV